MTFRHTVRAGAIIASAVIALGACSGNAAEESPAAQEPERTTLVPGAPGEPNATMTDAPPQPVEPFNEVDREFVEMMVPHHQQAVEMGELAAKQAQDKRVIEFAARILDSQSAEIDSMQAWLESRDLPAARLTPDAEHADMAGMLTPAQVTELSEARGAAFDALYLQRMIAHHRGALEMAELALNEGIEPINRTLAADIAAKQTTEIGLLQGILDSL